MEIRRFGDTQVPFAVRESDGEVVSVQEVPNGNKCGCVCVSCNTPMTARQGSTNVWHFAHRTLKGYERTQAKCEYSFFVSIRLMIKQLANQEFQFALPGHNVTASRVTGGGVGAITKQVVVTSPSKPQLEKVVAQADFFGTLVDILGQVKGMPLAIYVTYPSREVPMKLRQSQLSPAGVVEVDLRELNEILYRQHKSGLGYTEGLKDYLANSICGKSWVFHPRGPDLVAKAEAELEAQSKAALSHPPKRHIDYDDELVAIDKSVTPDLDKQNREHRCAYCGVIAQWSPESGLMCPSCKSSLYLVPL